jgi:renalase
MNAPLHIAVIGAGLAGLSCATALQQAGHQLSVFDKSRRPSGRMSTRRGEGWQCDHGAQYFTARDPGFRAEVARWQQAGAAALWSPRMAVLPAGVGAPASRHAGHPDAAEGSQTSTDRFVGTPGMSAPGAFLAESLNLQTEATVQALSREAGGWRLTTAEQGLLATHFDAVVLALPAPQALALVRGHSSLLSDLAERTVMRGSWALMLRHPAPLDLAFDAAFVNAGPLRWVARDSSKPGRLGQETWLLHATAAWSEAHLEDEPEQVAEALLAAWADLGGAAPEAWTAHRWRYADTAGPADGSAAPAEGWAWQAELGLGLCGDWLNGGKVEGAWLSGQGLARLLTHV